MTRHQLKPRRRPKIVEVQPTSPPLKTFAWASDDSTRDNTAENSAYNSDDEGHGSNESRATPPSNLSFTDIPSEVRLQIYNELFDGAPLILDIGRDNRTLRREMFSIFRVNRLIGFEAMHTFYHTHAVRIFPTELGKYFKSKRPLLARLSPRIRESLSILVLTLGPGFAAPPQGWVVNRALGLADCRHVGRLRIFVCLDPSNEIIHKFMESWTPYEQFYEKFCNSLLRGLLESVSSIQEVQIDANPGVPRNSSYLEGLLDIVREHGKKITWGPERGWAEEEDGKGGDELAAAMERLEVLEKGSELVVSA